MPKNLTDYSSDKHEQMVGMWCYIFDHKTEPDTPVGEGIIAGYRKTNDGRTVVIIDNPRPDGGKREYELHNIVPRFDVWNIPQSNISYHKEDYVLNGREELEQ